MRLYRVTPTYLFTTNWDLLLIPEILMLPICCTLLFFYVVTAYCFSPHMIIIAHSTQRIAHWQILISTKKVNYISFQQLHHNYVTFTRNLFLITLSIPPWFNLVLFFIGWLLYNSKSSIPNGSASPFGRIMFRLLLSTMTPGSLLSLSAFAMAPRTLLLSVTMVKKSLQFSLLPKT